MSQPGPLEQPPEELNSEPKARDELWSEHHGALEPEPFRVRTDSSSVGVSRRSNHCSIFCVWDSHGVVKQGPPVHILQGVETR